MKRVLMGLAIVATMAFGVVGNASAVEIDLYDGHALAWMFGVGGVDGTLMSGAEVMPFLGETYEVLLFSAFSSATNVEIYAGATLVDTMNGTMNGKIGHNYSNYTLGAFSIHYGGNTYNYADAGNYTSTFQAYILNADTLINGVLYGKNSIFIGFEDGTDYDYNDLVLAFKAPAVPVPAAAWLLGTGLAGLMALRRKGA